MIEKFYALPWYQRLSWLLLIALVFFGPSLLLRLEIRRTWGRRLFEVIAWTFFLGSALLCTFVAFGERP